MIRKSHLKYTKRDNQPMERSLLLFENSVKSKITLNRSEVKKIVDALRPNVAKPRREMKNFKP